MTGPRETTLQRVEQLRQLAADGMSQAQAARTLGVTPGAVNALAKQHSIGFARAKSVLAGRNDEWLSMFKQGVTMSKIGAKYGVTRELVRQVLARMGVTGADGGLHLVTQGKRAAYAAGVRRRQETRWGLPYETCKELRRTGVIRSYEQQKANANRRAIPWDLSFSQWYAIWAASGKLDQRGKGKGKFCMSRIADAGPYAAGNVHIQLCTDNSREAVKQWRGKTKVHVGVFHLYPGRALAFKAKVGKQSLGYFASAEEATQARRAFLAAAGKVDCSGLGRGKGWTLLRRCRARPYMVQAVAAIGLKASYHATQDEAEAEYKRRCAEVLAARAKEAA